MAANECTRVSVSLSRPLTPPFSVATGHITCYDWSSFYLLRSNRESSLSGLGIRTLDLLHTWVNNGGVAYALSTELAEQTILMCFVSIIESQIIYHFYIINVQPNDQSFSFVRLAPGVAWLIARFLTGRVGLSCFYVIFIFVNAIGTMSISHAPYSVNPLFCCCCYCFQSRALITVIMCHINTLTTASIAYS